MIDVLKVCLSSFFLWIMLTGEIYLRDFLYGMKKSIENFREHTL